MILLDPTTDERNAALHRALAVFPYVLPTAGKREALARAFWRLACRARTMPGGAVMIRACIARIEILAAPVEFDANAYDNAAGVAYAFTIDWWNHAFARAIYRAQPKA